MGVHDKLRLIREGVLDNNESIINEAYYGKNPQLLKCEKLLDKALESSSGYKELKEVERILEKMFNFKRLVLSNLTIPGRTLSFPITTYKFKYLNNDIKMKRVGTGIQFSDEDSVESIIFIDLSMMHISKLNGSEVLAMILHEIGHSMRTLLPDTQLVNTINAVSITTLILPAIMVNFASSAVLSTVDVLTRIKNILVDTFSPLQRTVKGAIKSVFLGRKNLLAHTRTIRFLTSVARDSSGAKKFGSEVKFIALKTLGLAKNINPVRKAISLALRLSSLLRFKEEQLADIIATSYGYGEELVSGMSKLDNHARLIRLDNPIFRLVRLPFNLINTILDPHPKNITRFKSILSNLEDELKKSINIDAYKEISQDIEMVKKKIVEYEEQISKHKIRNFDIIVFRKIMGKLIDGNDDIRVMFMGLKPEDLKKLDDLEKLPQPTKDPKSMQEVSEILLEVGATTPMEKELVISILEN